MKIVDECDELANEAAIGDCLNQSRCLSVLKMASGLALRTHFESNGGTPIRIDLARVISFTLESVIKANSQSKKHLLFDCPVDTEPSVAIGDYVARFSQMSPVEDEVLITAIGVMDRFIAYESPRGFSLAEANVHRLWAAAFVISQKWLDDNVLSNGFYAKISGVKINELNALERAFLIAVNFSVGVCPEEFELYRSSAVSLASVLQHFTDLQSFVITAVRELRCRFVANQLACALTPIV